MKQVDLHVHSTRSDGTYSPSRLVDYAMKKNLAAFALTDHDTIDGLQEAIDYADSLRQKPDILPDCVPEVIPGIEFSTEYAEHDVHIVGLNIDYQNTDFLVKLQDFADSRTLRNRKMCQLLCQAGIPICYENLLKEFPDSVITRAHYAKYMIQHGYVKSMAEAFDRYVGDRAPCYVPREKVTPIQAVRLIQEAGGIPVLAHPILYHMSAERLDQLTAELTEAGLIGIEAIYSTYKPYEERQIRQLAQKYHLCISGGSDFHGENKPGLDLAVGYGRLFVPYEIWENMKSRHC